MSSVTGPISSLPGSYHAVPSGQRCDDCGAPATARIQGETDSMGCEMFDLCESCLEQMREDMRPMNEGRCDWCKKDSTDLRSKRDYEEGMSGPVYYVCKACADRYDERMRQEDDYWDDLMSWWDD